MPQRIPLSTAGPGEVFMGVAILFDPGQVPVRWRTDRGGAGMEHGVMKNIFETVTERYTAWLNTSWSMVTGTPLPAKDPSHKAAQVAAVQEWEDEGGAIKPAKTPEAEPTPKLPL
jgi:hypothetical protein